MKQKVLLLVVLALGMCSINVSAQTKEYKVEDDGFEWYKILKKDGYKTFGGAQDKYGRTIVPAKYSEYINYDNGIIRVHDGGKEGAYDTRGNLIIPVEYWSVTVYPVEGLEKENSLVWVMTDYHGYYGFYNVYGRCVIPVSRKYKHVYAQKDRFYCDYSDLSDKESLSKRVICDASGKVIFATQNECKSIDLINDANMGKYAIIKDNKFFVDKDDNILLDPQCFAISYKKKDNINSIIIYKTKGGTARRLTQTEMNKVLQNGNLLSGNKDYFANNSMLAKRMENNGGQYKNTNSSSSNSSSSSSNSGSSTTTIVVEQHGPVQVWVACGGCQLEPGKCTYCHGSGWGYNNRLCSRCGGNGKCTICGGNGGHYEVQYR